MLDYALAFVGLLSDVPEQILNLNAELAFNDGSGPAGQDADQAWSHAVFGVSTDIDLSNNLALTPAVYHQIGMDNASTAITLRPGLP